MNTIDKYMEAAAQNRDPLKNDPYRYIVISILILFICASLPCGQVYGAKDPAPSMRLHAIYQDRPDNESAGDAVLLESDEEFLLMDTGLQDPKSSDKTIKYLEKVVGTGQAQKPLSIYISHYHGDHTGAIALICEKFRIDNFYFPSLSLYKQKNLASINKGLHPNLYENRAKCEIAASREIEENRALSHTTRVYELTADDRIKVGGNKDVSLRIFPVTGRQAFEGDSSRLEDKFINNNSLATMVTCGKTRYLTAGDIERDTEERLENMDKISKISIRAEIFKLDHHGLRTTKTQVHWANFPEFLALVKPKISFVQGKGDIDLRERAEETNVIEGQKNAKYARSFNSMAYARKYGLCFNTTFEARNFIVNVSNNKIKLYKTVNATSVPAEKSRMKGITELVFYKITKDDESFIKMRYYVDPQKGYRTKSKLVTLKEDGKKYLFHVSHTGRIAQKKRVKAGKYCYYFDKEGHAVKNQSVTYDGKVYYYGANGRELTGKGGKVRIFK